MSELFTTFSDSFLDNYRNKVPNFGFEGFGYIVYKRTYARTVPDLTKESGTRLEEWWETIRRCIEGAQKIGAKYSNQEAEMLFDHMFNFRGLYSGRMLWQLGTSTVDRFGANSLLACWYVSTREPKAFDFIFENLMLGGGLGFSVRKEHIHELPKIKKNVKIIHQSTKDADFIVPDKREGWVKLLHNVLDSYFNTGIGFTYSTLLIRPYGEPISGFGGTASGPGILVDGISKICNVLKSREGKKLRSVDVLDIINIIGSIVVAGNVRRSAQIAIGDPDDYLYIRAKRWDLGNIPNWRAMSNNSIDADSYEQISDDIWKGYDGNGEPYGFINTKLMQTQGRLGEKINDDCEGVNPCGEISLESYECCNLSEVFLNNIQSKEQLIEVTKLLFKTQKAICLLPFIHKETEKIVRKNMRIGLSVSGICQVLGTDDLDNWLDDTYKALRKFDKALSREWNCNESIKITTVKPSGTLSLLAGSTPGVHAGIYEFFIRRVRISSDNPLIDQCKKLGFTIEDAIQFDGSIDRTTKIICIPNRYDKNTFLAKHMTAIDQLELLKRIQTHWSDNSVSITIYYKKEELPKIKDWLKENYETSVKTVSFLLHNEHGFKQAPYEEISEKEYLDFKKKIKPISSLYISTESISGDLDLPECASGVCPIK